MSIDEDTRIALGHSFGPQFSAIENATRIGFIYQCVYRGINCNNASYWDIFNHPKYGNCFSFNSGVFGKEVRKVTVTGSNHGLVLELFLDQTNYMYNKLSRMAGARIDVHDPHSIPRPDEFGTSLSPNTATSLSIQVNEITRM